MPEIRLTASPASLLVTAEKRVIKINATTPGPGGGAAVAAHEAELDPHPQYATAAEAAAAAPVQSVAGKTGEVELTSDDVANLSSATGANVTDALNHLHNTKPSSQGSLSLNHVLIGAGGQELAASSVHLGSLVLYFEHIQSAAAAVWTVAHNLGRRPVVQVFSAGGVEVWAAILHLNVNTVQISFQTPQTGTAVCQA